MENSAQSQVSTATALRARAEEKLRRHSYELAGLSAQELQAAIHELHVHQIELEMQNEQLRAAQEELEQARERYVELYDFAPVSYLTLNKEGIIQKANLRSVSMLAVERSRLVSQAFSRFVFGADQDSYSLCWRKIFAYAGQQVCELRLRTGTGVVFHARLEAVRATEGGKDVCRMTISDISEQKRIEKSFRESEQMRLKYENEEWKRLALEAGELGAWDQDLQTGRITCSERACAMLGFAPDDSFNWTSVVERVHPEDRAALSAELEKGMNPEGPRHCEAVFRIKLSEGSFRWLRFLAGTFFEHGPLSRPLRRTGVLVDITKQKEAEEMLKSRAQELDELVRERTARLQETVADLEYLSYTLVHDLRAPLRAIATYTELLSEECSSLDEMQQQYLKRSHAAALRMDNLIVDALSYSKIVREQFHVAPVDCAALLNQLLETYPQFQEARKAIVVEGAFPAVLGNPALLTQCFSNLLTNALKFVEPGKTPAVRIFAEDKGQRVRLWFQDNGIGISQEGQQRIFKMFQRLNHDYEGTGIGLALVKKAAERMGGAVAVESQPGNGSRFWLELDKA